MRVAMYYRNDDVRSEEMPVPEISDRELLVKVKLCGICGSDVMEWYRVKKAPLVLGHEMTGDIVKLGKEVKGFEVGDRIFVSHHVPCNTCHYCLSDHHSVCDTLRTTNFVPGGFAEYLKVPEINIDRGVFKLPDGMSYEEGVFIEPLACVYRGLRMASFRPGQSVLIIGCGVTGLLFVKLLKALGAGQVITTDINDYKLGKSWEFGADALVNAQEDVEEMVQEVCDGRLADLVVCATGATPAVETALRTVARGGTILFFAPSDPGADINFPLERFWKDEITVTTSYAASPLDIETAIELIRSGRLEVEDMITHRLPLREAGKGFRLVASSEESLKVIVDVEK